MKALKRFGLKNCLLVLICLALAVLSAVCFVHERSLAGMLLSQKAAERWRGDNETEYAQVSCFIPESEKITLTDVYGFRTKLLTKLNAAGYDTEDYESLFQDAWYCSGSVSAEGEAGKGTASVMAVGGNYFLFHPLNLVTGSYFYDTDLNSDKVLLDEQLAWLLFGSSDVQGMEVQLNGKVFTVSGVISHETDAASTKAYSSGMCLYMSYDAWAALNETNTAAAGISCYELVCAEPVDGFTLTEANTDFPVKDGVILSNSARYKASSLLALLKDYGSRSMQTNGVLYPYWENAARYVEDRCVLFLLLGIVCAVLPVIVLLILLLRLLNRGKERLSGELIPELEEGVSERIRREEHRRWAKAHPEEAARIHADGGQAEPRTAGFSGGRHTARAVAEQRTAIDEDTNEI